MFLLFVLALSWTLTRAQFYSCLNGGTGPCINGQCVDATQQCINTTAGEICCEISQIVSESTSVTTPATACVDQLNPKTGRSDCPSRANLCSNAIYRSIMESQCPRTCGFCTIGGTTQPQPGATACVDMINLATGKSDCGDRYNLCHNPIYRDLMMQQCRKTCGYC